MTRAKVLGLFAVLLGGMLLSACDHCGDPVRAQNGSALMACKGDAPNVR